MPESNKDEGKASCFKTALAVVLGTSLMLEMRDSGSPTWIVGTEIYYDSWYRWICVR